MADLAACGKKWENFFFFSSCSQKSVKLNTVIAYLEFYCFISVLMTRPIFRVPAMSERSIKIVWLQFVLTECKVASDSMILLINTMHMSSTFYGYSLCSKGDIFISGLYKDELTVECKLIFLVLV